MTSKEEKDAWYRNLPRSFRIGSSKDYDSIVHFHGLWIKPLPSQKSLPIVFDEHYSKTDGIYSQSNGVFTAPEDGTYMARVRVGAMDSESAEWIFPDFEVETQQADGVLTFKVNVTDPEDSRLFVTPPRQLKLSKGDNVRLVVESKITDAQWKGRTPGITFFLYDVMALINAQTED